ncbi:glycosyltransferase family 2 protein [Sandarakinorhabdus sp.]|uniref:glycosyltransferase family 2 protein n=1 Tax=Sandarakinorhabdus sp. TaxID=1916663 RepID=UPI00333F370D
MAAPKLSPILGVVIVNFRGAADTIECLESLLRCPLQMKIVVVENGSGDDSVARLRGWAAGTVSSVAESAELAGFSTPPMAKPIAMAEVTTDAIGKGPIAPLSMIVSPDNLGFAGGNNLGLRHLRSDPRLTAFWLLNNDTVVTPESPGALLIRMLATPRVGMCGTVVRHYWEPSRLQALNGSSFNLWTGMGRSLGGEEPATMTYSPQDVADATDYVLGASLAVSRGFLDAVGPMAEAYFLYFEEADWAWRNRRLGSDRFEIAFAHGATVFHKAGSSIGSSSARSARSPFSEYWLARSRLKFIWRFARLLWPWHWALCWALVLRRLIRRKPAHANAIARAALGLKP